MIHQVNETTIPTPTGETTPEASKKAVPSQALDIKLARAAKVIAGIQLHTGPLAKRGIDTAFIADFSASYQRTVDTRNTRLSFKARMMEKTAQLQVETAQLHAYYAEARNLIKLTLPKATWREFGIEDQRL